VDSNHAICNHVVNESTRRAHLTHSRCIWKSGFGEIYFNSFGRKVFWRFLGSAVQFLNLHKIPITRPDFKSARSRAQTIENSKGLCKTNEQTSTASRRYDPHTTFIASHLNCRKIKARTRHIHRRSLPVGRLLSSSAAYKPGSISEVNLTAIPFTSKTR
jgi:hypothetical protein